mgnify:CR=1 FL=1
MKPDVTKLTESLQAAARQRGEAAGDRTAASSDRYVTITVPVGGAPTVEIDRALIPDPQQRELAVQAVSEAVAALLAPDQLPEVDDAFLQDAQTFLAEGQTYLETQLAKQEQQFTNLRRQIQERYRMRGPQA